MEQSQPETLASILAREGPLETDRALALMKETARTVAQWHAAGTAHCYLQPETVFVTQDGQVMLGESPLARPIGEPRPPDPSDAQPSAVPLYYPPEAAHAWALDQRTDLFLLGGTFYHAMTGRPPFDGGAPEARALQYIRHDAPPLTEAVPGVPVLVNVLVQKLLRRNPLERYQSATELVEVIERTERMLQKRQAARGAAPAAAQPVEAQPEQRPRAQHLTPTAAAQAAEAEPRRRPRTRRLSAPDAEREVKPRRRPTTARAGTAKQPLWKSKPFIYAAAGGGFLLIVVVAFLLSGGRRRPELAKNPGVTPDPSAIEQPAVKPPPPPPTKEPKQKPKDTTPVKPPKAKPQTSTITEPPDEFPPATPKGKETTEPTKSRWQAVKGTASGTETYEEFLERTKDLFTTEDYIVAWHYAGPYRHGNTKGPQGLFNIVFPPEKELAGEALPADEAPKWGPLPAGTPGSNAQRPWLMEFDKARDIKGENAVIYLRTRVLSPKTQEVQLMAGSDDGIKIWLNGDVVHSNNTDRGVTPDSDKVRVVLNKGWNSVLVKITQGKGQWGFCFRFRDADGDRLRDIKADPTGK